MLPSGFSYFAEDNQGNALPASGALQVQTAAVTNLADTADALASPDTINLGTGTYTLRVSGDAAVTVAAGTATITGGGQATVAAERTFVVTGAGTVTLTKDSGTLDTTTDGRQVIWLVAGSTAAGLPPISGTLAAANPVPKYDAAAGKDVVVDYRGYQVGQNLLTGDNSTFDNGVGDWNLPSLDGQHTHNAVDGSLRVTRAFGTTGFITAYLNLVQYAGATVGGSYELRLRARKLLAVDRPLQVRLGNTGQTVIPAVNGGGWVDYKVVDTLDAVNSMVVFIDGGGTPTLGDWFEIDNISVREVDFTTIADQSKTVKSWTGEITGAALGITEPFQVTRLEVYEPGEAP